MTVVIQLLIRDCSKYRGCRYQAHKRMIIQECRCGPSHSLVMWRYWTHESFAKKKSRIRPGRPYHPARKMKLCTACQESTIEVEHHRFPSTCCPTALPCLWKSLH